MIEKAELHKMKELILKAILREPEAQASSISGEGRIGEAERQAGTVDS